jgi:phosphatidylinositol-3-phosphatase
VRIRRALPALIALLALSACGSGSPGSPATRQARALPSLRPCGRAGRAPRRYAHVIWIVMENKSYSEVLGSSQAPYIRALAAACGVATRFTAESHPSLPNYIAMTSGSTQRISDDADPSAHTLAAPSIFSQLRSGWRALEEAMPAPCARSNAGRYAVRHNPAAYYTRLRASCRRQDVPLTTPPNLSARFTFVTPDVCHDMHDCSVAAGDGWLAGFVPRVVRSREYATGRTALFITWDEDDGSSANLIPTLVVAPHTRPGTRSARPFSHYSMLRTTEELLGLRVSLGAAARAPSMRAAFGL